MINISTRQLLKPPWYTLLRDLLKTVKCHIDHLCLLNNLMRGHHPGKFQKHWLSNQTLLSTVYVLLNQSARQSYQSVFYVPVYQSDAAIQKSMNILKIALHNWFLKHPQDVQYQIFNNFIKLYIHGQAGPQLVPNFRAGRGLSFIFYILSFIRFKLFKTIESDPAYLS